MIKIIFDDIFNVDLTNKSNTIRYFVHGCNAQGVMGGGIAKQVRELYPEVYLTYRAAYESSGLRVGNNVNYVKPTDGSGTAEIFINAITQEFYGNTPGVCYVSYPGIRSCFLKIAADITAIRNKLIELMPDEEFKIYLDFPLIGCGLGGGSFEIIAKIIEECIPDVLAEKRLFIR